MKSIQTPFALHCRAAFFILFWLCLCVGTFAQSNIQQSVSINASGAAPAGSAMLDVNATDKGMLVPRMTSAQRMAIASPATGLLVFDTTTGTFWFYNGTSWVSISMQSMLADADGDTRVQVEKNPNEDIIRFDLGGTENMVLRKNASGITRLELPTTIENTFIGQNAGANNTTGSSNTATGRDALLLNTIGSSNTATGGSALRSNTTGNYNTAHGEDAMFSNTTGSFNTAQGEDVMRSNTTGSRNTAQGESALFSNTTGSANVAVGARALFRNTNRDNLVAVGDSALYNNSQFATHPTHSVNNTAVGSKALFANQIGAHNTAVGFRALFSCTDAVHNTAVGTEALYSTTIGGTNTAVGRSALYSILSGTSNTALGHEADVSATNLVNSTAIGRGATVNASNKARIGNANVTVIEGQVDWTFPSDARFKFNIHDDAVPGLAFIEKLRPVTYQFDTRKFDEHLMQKMPDSIRQSRMEGQDYSRSTASLHTGFLAQEVEQACKDLKFQFSGLHLPESEVDNYGLAYGSFVPLLVKAVQEQQQIIGQEKSKVEDLAEQTRALEAENAALKAQLGKVVAALTGLGVVVE